MVPEDYVHRIGRTGRAGVDGEAVSLVCVDELQAAPRHRARARPRRSRARSIAGFEPDPRIRPEPILRGGLGGARPGAGPRHPAALASRPVIGPPPAPNRGGGYAPARHAEPRPVGHRPNGPRPAAPGRGAQPGRPSQPGQWLGQRPAQPGRPVATAGTLEPARPSGPASRPARVRARCTAPAHGRRTRAPRGTPRPPCPASASLGTAAAPTADQRARPSRNVATDFSIRRWRVSSVFAPSTWRTCQDWLL